MRYYRKLAVVAGLAVAATVTSAAVASAAPAPTSAHAVTHVVNRPDSGNGGDTWAYDSFNRTLSVALAPSQAGAPAGDTLYVATVTDAGSFSARQGELAPNQVTPGVKIAHAVKGTMQGSISYTVTAPTADLLTGAVPASENDNFAAALVTTANWPLQAFASSTGVTATESTGWSWTYQTACEKWTDSSANGSGNTAAAGNITGKLCTPAKPPANVPSVFAGHVVDGTLTQTTATVGWSDSKTGWPSSNQCVVVLETGYGFSNNHWGFTCNNGDPTQNIGKLWGLTRGHTYALDVIPAAPGSTYANHAPFKGADLKGHITVVTAS